MRPTALGESMPQDKEEQESSKCHAWNESFMSGQQEAGKDFCGPACQILHKDLQPCCATEPSLSSNYPKNANRDSTKDNRSLISQNGNEEGAKRVI